MPLRIIEQNDEKCVVYCKVHDAKEEGKTYEEARFKLKEKLGILKIDDYYD